MEDNNFTIDAVVQHHYFSGKDCPQTKRTAGLWDYFKTIVLTEYQMIEYQKWVIFLNLNLKVNI